jgi:hypothetical protein
MDTPVEHLNQGFGYQRPDSRIAFSENIGAQTNERPGFGLLEWVTHAT